MSNKSGSYFISTTFNNLSLEDVIALINFFKAFEKNGTLNHSSYLAYFADGQNKFKPQVMFHSNLPQDLITKYTPLSWTFSSDPNFIPPDKPIESKPKSDSEKTTQSDNSAIIPLTIFGSNLIEKQINLELENWKIKNTINQIQKKQAKALADEEKAKRDKEEKKEKEESQPPFTSNSKSQPQTSPQDPGQNVHEQFDPNPIKNEFEDPLSSLREAL